MSITVLLAEVCPPKIRGSVFGVQSFFGALGILAISWGGGQLFDLVGPTTPILAIALANALVFVYALTVRSIESRSVE